jgi:hypothetical protein
MKYTRMCRSSGAVVPELAPLPVPLQHRTPTASWRPQRCQKDARHHLVRAPAFSQSCHLENSAEPPSTTTETTETTKEPLQSAITPHQPTVYQARITIEEP